MDSLVPLSVGNTQIEGQTKSFILPDQYVASSKGSVTPSVKNVTRLVFLNMLGIVVTDLKDGQDGQSIKILGDGFTTLSQNVNIILNGGAGGNVLLAATTVYELTRFNGKWYGKP